MKAWSKSVSWKLNLMRARQADEIQRPCLHFAFNRKRNFTHLRILHRRYSHRVTIFVSGTRSYDYFLRRKRTDLWSKISNKELSHEKTLKHYAGVFYNCLAWRNRHKWGTWWRHMTFDQCPALRYIERDSDRC